MLTCWQEGSSVEKRVKDLGVTWICSVDSLYPNPGYNDLYWGIKSPKERKQMHFAWKRENSRVWGALLSSSNLIGQWNTEKQKTQYSCWLRKQNQITGEAHRDAWCSPRVSCLFLMPLQAECPPPRPSTAHWLAECAGQWEKPPDVGEIWFLHCNWSPQRVNQCWVLKHQRQLSLHMSQRWAPKPWLFTCRAFFLQFAHWVRRC